MTVEQGYFAIGLLAGIWTWGLLIYVKLCQIQRRGELP